MTTLTESMTSGLAKIGAALGQIGRRLLVHMGALMATGLLGSALTGTSYDSVNTLVATYIGLICLFPRGNPRDPAWYVPTLLGLVQALVLVALGLHWSLVILWAGLQTWVQRLLSCRGSFGWEWSVAPMLAVSLCLTLQDFLQWRIALWPLLSVPLVVALGAVGMFAYRRSRAESIHKKMLADSLQRLRNTLSWRVLPEDAQQQGDLLLAQASAWKIVANAEDYALAERLDKLCRDVEGMASELRVLKGSGASAGAVLARTVLRSSRWQDKTAHPKMRALLKDIRDCNAAMLQVLSRQKPEKSNDAARQDDAGRMAAHEDSARQLLLKKPALPEELARHVESISASALGIVDCMRKDPADMPGGHKFLGRYLQATHRVVDEYVRLAAENSGQEDVNAALQRSGELLERMATAFADERTSMLQNDAMNYTAELNALDAMLKMRGK